MNPSFKSQFRVLAILCFALLLGARSSRAQSCGLRVSLLTCASGDDLYATFGHSALRVIDSADGRDYVFNYGTFDMDTPHFYWKFVRGRLMYSLSVSDFPSFMEEYHEEKRRVTEQVLSLSCTEKQAVWEFLRENYTPRNRYYKYDFLFDNCATRIRDIFERVLGEGWQLGNIVPVPGLSYREIINQYLHNKPWERVGINLMFGKRTDAAMDSRTIQFLPRYLETAFDSVRVHGRPLVETKVVVYDPGETTAAVYPLWSRPMVAFSLVAILVIVASFNGDRVVSRAVLPWVDRCLFFITGLLGCFLLFMWFGTDHKVCAWNYNLLWAFPPNIVFSFFAHRTTPRVRRYATWVIVLNLVLLLGWFVLPQQLIPETVPFIAMLVVRAWQIAIRPRIRLR